MVSIQYVSMVGVVIFDSECYRKMKEKVHFEESSERNLKKDN